MSAKLYAQIPGSIERAEETTALTDSRFSAVQRRFGPAKDLGRTAERSPMLSLYYCVDKFNNCALFAQIVGDSFPIQNGPL
ncbi:hypothetical protein A8B75_04630 [Sphingomonadales bacterium EhC05]|jgi:hypothetical protein|nr:hypothetical protein A8B75_04630 [Sphingomonadales bacterium EhC05]